MDTDKLVKIMDKNIQKKGLKLRFGLEQQGHIPDVEEMLSRHCSWQEINRVIGWAGTAAQEDYERYTRRKLKVFNDALQEIIELPSYRQDEAHSIAAGAMDSF